MAEKNPDIITAQDSLDLAREVVARPDSDNPQNREVQMMAKSVLAHRGTPEEQEKYKDSK